MSYFYNYFKVLLIQIFFVDKIPNNILTQFYTILLLYYTQYAILQSTLTLHYTTYQHYTSPHSSIPALDNILTLYFTTY